MTYEMVFRHVFVSTLLLSFVLGGPLGQDGNILQSGLEEDIEERPLAQLLKAERETQVAKEKKPKTDSEEVKTVHKIDSDRTQIDIFRDSKLIQQRLLDCGQRFEIIVMNVDGTDKALEACFLHKMEDELYKSVCQSQGEMVYKVYDIGEQIIDKDFLSDDGPVSVCKNRPMFMITPAVDGNQGKSSRRELQVNKRACTTSCGLRCSGGNCNVYCELVCTF